MRISLLSWLSLIPVCSLFLSFLVFAVSGQCQGKQQSLLLDLKNSIKFNSTLATKLVYWNESTDCCSWEGVTCSEGRIVGLNLDSESIYGGLDNSSSLFLSPISPKPELYLESQDFATLVQNLSHLTKLYLNGVFISAPGIEWCKALSSSMPNLRVLSMSYCFLSRPFHSSLKKLQSLSVIHLNNNRFYVTIPEFFEDFTNLSSLKLNSSRLIRTLPRKILQVPTLQLLDLSKNELNGTLPKFHPNGALQSLLLSKTKFLGTLPTSIGNLKRLSKLDLSSCNFNGSIPISMENLTHLVHLNMSFNNFSGPVPSFIMAKNLKEINLSNNNLTGQITFNYWKELQSLVNLDLRYNSLEGSIPMSLFSLPLFQKLQYSYNNFPGQLPEFFNISSYQLDTLDLISKNLEGPIPMSIFELRGLQNLLLSSNNFSGSWKLNAFQQLRNLSNLGLSHNSLLIECNGANSSSFPKIESLGLASSKLKTVPDFLRNQSNLVILDPSDNQILGEIPNWV
nr:receptor-like protein 12 [Quercus suber]